MHHLSALSSNLSLAMAQCNKACTRVKSKTVAQIRTSKQTNKLVVAATENQRACLCKQQGSGSRWSGSNRKIPAMHVNYRRISSSRWSALNKSDQTNCVLSAIALDNNTKSVACFQRLHLAAIHKQFELEFWSQTSEQHLWQAKAHEERQVRFQEATNQRTRQNYSKVVSENK